MKLKSLTLVLLPFLGAPLVAGPAQDGTPEQGQATEGAAPAAAAKAKPFLWRLEGNGVTAHIFGTLHLPDARVTALPATVEAAFTTADAFYAEIEATPASEMAVASKSVLEAGVTLDALLGESDWGRVTARFQAAGVGVYAQAMVGMKPWALNATLPMLDYLPQLFAGKAPLDKALYQRAAAEKKRVGGLETVDEQIAVFEIFSRQEQIRMLRDSLDQLEAYDREGRNIMEETVKAWLSGEVAKLLPLLDDGFGSDSALAERAEDALLWKRNVRLADRIHDRLKAAPAEEAFFAVGALHMVDEPIEPDATEEEKAKAANKVGILALLKRKGYRIERVESDAAVPATAR